MLCAESFKMIGKQPSLEQIALVESPPEPVSLTCHEVLDEEEPQGDPYIISAPCVHCPRTLRIAVLGTSGGILTLQNLLTTLDVQICCAVCAKERRYYG